MSQQHMDPFEPRVGYSEYGALPQYDNYSNAFREKLTMKPNPASLSPSQRLALAISSLVLWVIVCIIVVAGIFHVAATINLYQNYQTPVDNPYAAITYVLLISALVLFTALVLAVNILFNRKR